MNADSARALGHLMRAVGVAVEADQHPRSAGRGLAARGTAVARVDTLARTSCLRSCFAGPAGRSAHRRDRAAPRPGSLPRIGAALTHSRRGAVLHPDSLGLGAVPATRRCGCSRVSPLCCSGRCRAEHPSVPLTIGFGPLKFHPATCRTSLSVLQGGKGCHHRERRADPCCTRRVSARQRSPRRHVPASRPPAAAQ